MGKRIYTQVEVSQLIKNNINELEEIYISNSNELALGKINEDLLKALKNFKAKFAYQPISSVDFNGMKNKFDRTFAIDPLPKNPIVIRPNSFLRVINDNSSYDFIYNYFVLTSSSQYGLGIRFSKSDAVEDNYYQDDSFYILENEFFIKVEPTDFETAVTTFHSRFDSKIASKGLGATRHIVDELKYAKDIAQRNPTKISMFSTVYGNKLSFAGIAEINGNDEYFNRGQQWP
ncbi:hypothetical protein QX233_01770 [Chryseobacterium gambrini]|uniref:Uncharacterized protein n=1 Tax=Chryseobacterium gambrini TaxID=373672 RepID=A0AAJ1VJ10_9FLAO|nr:MULTISPECIES: hypothetical protein [Chryseobacterium]MDN4011181.1 hypothetical protein [Chryseobacterium gambrini]MDN4030960.1 hypothetical protein [Chryseobacterium gambrini]QWA37516.1 hypothetical protein KKI44_16500 [Chryseobacterium sp. ZHDP1]